MTQYTNNGEKIINRNYLEPNNNGNYDIFYNGQFIEVGQVANGQKAYSRLNEQGEEIEEDAGMFVQIRYMNKLTMLRI